MDESKNNQKNLLANELIIADLGKTVKAIDFSRINQSFFESMHKSLAQQATASISLSSVAQKVIDSMKKDYDIHKRLVEQATASISLSSAAQSVLDSLKNNEAFYRSVASLAQPAYRDSAFDLVNKSILNNSSNLSYENLDFDIDELEDNIEKLSGAEDQNKFSNIFAKIPLHIQMIIVFIFMQIILPHINNISANLITPYVNEYLLSSKATDKEKIKEIRKININDPFLEIDKLRFIPRDKVILRSGPNRKTEKLDELCLGQVVTVLSKKRHWIEVQYINQDKEIIHGWVFTRYTARFKK